MKNKITITKYKIKGLASDHPANKEFNKFMQKRKLIPERKEEIKELHKHNWQFVKEGKNNLWIGHDYVVMSRKNFDKLNKKIEWVQEPKIYINEKFQLKTGKEHLEKLKKNRKQI